MAANNNIPLFSLLAGCWIGGGEVTVNNSSDASLPTLNNEVTEPLLRVRALLFRDTEAGPGDKGANARLCACMYTHVPPVSAPFRFAPYLRKCMGVGDSERAHAMMSHLHQEYG